MELSPQYQQRWDKFRDNFSHILKTYLPVYDEQLKMMRGDLCNIPNVLLYSVYGFPLDLVWKEGLRRRFNVDNKEGFLEKECVWGKNIPYRETPYYFQIDMANPDIPNDLEMLQEFLKTVISASCIHSDRHIIILENIDHFINKNINRHVFRVLLERFSKNVWFICTTYHLTKLESPLRSRFYCIRFPLPSEVEINHIMNYLDKDVTKTDKKLVKYIYKTRNIIKAITTPKNKNDEFYWVSSLTYPPLSEYILQTKTVTIENIRAVVYKAFQAGVTLAEFARDIIDICVKRDDHFDRVSAIVREFATYEHMASQSKGTRILLYMEYMLHYVMTIVHNETIITKPRRSRKKETSELCK